MKKQDVAKKEKLPPWKSPMRVKTTKKTTWTPEDNVDNVVGGVCPSHKEVKRLPRLWWSGIRRVSA